MLRRSLIRYVEFGLEHPDHYIVTFCLPEPVEFIRSTGEDPGMACFDKLRSGVAACMSCGAIRNDDVETVSQSIFVMVHGLTGALITMKSFPWIDRPTLIRSSVENILFGLGAEA